MESASSSDTALTMGTDTTSHCNEGLVVVSSCGSTRLCWDGHWIVVVSGDDTIKYTEPFPSGYSGCQTPATDVLSPETRADETLCWEYMCKISEPVDVSVDRTSYMTDSFEFTLVCSVVEESPTIDIPSILFVGPAIDIRNTFRVFVSPIIRRKNIESTVGIRL